MHPRQSVPAGLLALASRQGGVVSREQCLGSSLSPHVVERLLAAGAWTPLGRGIYLTHTQRPSFEATCWGAMLAGGPHAIIGFEAAARLHGLAVGEPAVIEVFVPQPHRRRPGVPWTFVTADRRGRGEPSRTLLDDTVLDVATRLERDADLIGWFADVLGAHRTTPGRLLATLDERARYPRRHLVRDILGDVAKGVHSALERSYRREVEIAHGLPRGRRQAQLAGRSDVYYDEQGVVVELDGRLGHTGSGAFRDLDRDNRNTARNLVTLRYGHHDLTVRPCEVAEQVAGLLAARGWNGALSPCARCNGALLA